MEYIILILLIGIFSSGILLFSKKEHPKNQNISISNSSTPPNLDICEKKDATIRFEPLPDDVLIDTSSLLEIKDPSVLSRIDSLIPGLIQASTATNIANQVTTQPLYQAIIPAGAKLSNSRDMSNAVRGFYRGSNGIKGHASFVAADQSSIAINSLASSAINISAIIVGQYYMTQINTKLSEIDTVLSKITTFLDAEYKGKVFSLISQTKEISSFKAEIIENEELRLNAIDKINLLKNKCIDLFEHAYFEIDSLTKNQVTNYDSYIEKLYQLQNWYTYQRILLDNLYEILYLEYTLHLGSIPNTRCFSSLSAYIQQSNQVSFQLREWHHAVQKYLEIELESNRMKRTGFDGIIHGFLGLFNDDQNYRSIPHNIVSLIQSQTTEYLPDFSIPSTDPFSEDIHLISKDGKLYYLPPSGLS